jgi:microcystin-dependent protein
MANYEATKYDFSGASLTGIEGVNTGLIVPWSAASTPSGFLDCDGAAVSRSTYAALFAVIGTTYGVGDGSTTFNLPDLTDRTIIGKSPTKALASTGGANTVAATGNVGGTLSNTTLDIPTIASHSHPMTMTGGGGGGMGMSCNPETQNCATPGVGQGTSTTGGGGAHSHPVSATFNGDAVSVLQPYVTTKYIIKT